MGGRTKYTSEKEIEHDHVRSALQRVEVQHPVKTACPRYGLVTDCDKLEVVGMFLKETEGGHTGHFILRSV